jgi:hypothetical protein
MVDLDGNVFEYSQFLSEFMSNPTHPDYRECCDNISSYNSVLSFASMGANVVDFRDACLRETRNWIKKKLDVLLTVFLKQIQNSKLS